MMPRRFDRILDDCLLRMDRGESLMDILAVYPAQAEKLKPLLLVAMLSRALPQPVPGYTALRVGKNQLLAEMASMQAEDSFIKPKPVRPPREGIVDRLARSLKQLQPAYRFAMLSLVVILTGGFFTLSASASGLADNIMQTLYFSFDQVGELFQLGPDSDKSMGEGILFSSDYPLPDSPGNFPGDYKYFLFEESEKNEEGAQPPGNEEPGNQGESDKKFNYGENTSYGFGEDEGQGSGQEQNQDNDNNSDGEKDNDNNKDGEKDNDNNSDGEKDNDNNKDGDKKEKDNNKDGDKKDKDK